MQSQEKQARIDAERARLEAIRVAPEHPLAVAAEAVSGQKVCWAGCGKLLLAGCCAAEVNVAVCWLLRRRSNMSH